MSLTSAGIKWIWLYLCKIHLQAIRKWAWATRPWCEIPQELSEHIHGHCNKYVETIFPQDMAFFFSSPFPDSLLIQYYPSLSVSTVKDHNLGLELDNPSLLASYVFIWLIL